MAKIGLDVSENKDSSADDDSTLLSGSVPNECSVLPKLSMNEWQDKPLLLAVHSSHNKYHKINNNHNNNHSIPMNKVFNLETNLFKGKAICRAIDMKSTEKWYFKGKNRKMSFTFQGEFKKKIRFDRLFTGQIFDDSFQKLPGKKLINGGLKLIKKLAPQLIAEIESDNPHLISPVCSAAQVIHIQKINDDGSIINELPKAAVEDVSILNPEYKGLNWEKRKKLFNNKELIKQYYFQPGFIYTISNYSHMISPSKYKLYIGGMRFNISNYIQSPIQINTILLPDDEQRESGQYFLNKNDNENTKIQWNTDNINLNSCEYLYNIQIWHNDIYNKMSKQQNIKNKSTENNEG